MGIPRRLLKYVGTLWPSLIKFDGSYLPASSLREILSMAPLLNPTHNSKPASRKSFWLPSVTTRTRLKVLFITKSGKSIGWWLYVYSTSLESAWKTYLFFPIPVAPDSIPLFSRSYSRFLEKSLYRRSLRSEGNVFDWLMMRASRPGLLICSKFRHLTIQSFRLPFNLD